MKSKFLTITLLILFAHQSYSQSYPTFGSEIKVSITGLSFDAMEPYISLDGNTLFFNSLNSGGNTNLYYATKVNDSTFTYEGLVTGCYDPSPSHLDGVASLDTLNNFFWVSLRNYPIAFENLHRGIYSNGNVNNITRVYGDFNIFTPGWIIMDAAISYHGNELYYCNAFFDSCTFGMPCEARLGIAEKINDSTFNKIINTDAIFSNVNDTNYIVYAPQVTKDDLELYFTRIQKTTINSEICVSVRNSLADTFSLPSVIHSNLGFIPEAASPSTDKQKIYYHQKDGTGIFHIYLRYRSGTTGISDDATTENIKVFPNPTNNLVNIVLQNPSEDFSITISSVFGQELLKTSNNSSIDISSFSTGIYLLIVNQNNRTLYSKIVKK